MTLNNIFILSYRFISKKIPECSNWDLVFTSLGKYFFHNKQSGERCWIPPQSVLSTLQDQSEMKMSVLFDPFHIEEDIVESDNEYHVENSQIQATKTNNSVDNEEAENEFKVYLLKNLVDPFAPWPTILALHSASPQFQAIPSDKRKQDLFASVCPLLIESRREESKKKLDGAREWWNGVMTDCLRDKSGWLQVLKKVKGNTKFCLLNEKECEKEYRARLNKK